MKTKVKRVIKYIVISLVITVLSALLLNVIGIGGTATCLECKDRIDSLEADLYNIGKTCDRLEDSVTVSSYLGTWYFPEPIVDISMLSTNANYDFSFSCYINGPAEIRNYSKFQIITVYDEDTAMDQSVIKYHMADGSNTVAYRTKYGVFAANSYQTITIHTEPPDEIKAFLDANAIYFGSADTQVIYNYQATIAALEERIAALEGATE